MEIRDIIMNIINNIQEAIIVVDQNERITFLNNSASMILGLSKDDVIGKNVIDIIPNTRLHIVTRTGIPEMDRIQHLGNKVIVTSRIPVRDSNGDIIGAVAVFRDVTSIQKLAEEVTNLREIEALLSSIIDSTHDAISVADEEGRIVMVNRAYTKITGYTPKEVIGKLATIDIAEGESLHIKCAKEKKPILNVRMKVGVYKKEVIINVTPIFVKGEFKGSVAVIHDISEIERLARDLEVTKKMLKKDKAKYTFDDIIGISEAINRVKIQAEKAADTNVTVLLQGEIGVGKELFAQAIHNASPRFEKPFITFNCALLPKEKQISVLFGDENEKGLLEKVDGGTLFIDNVQFLAPEVQQILLLLMNEGEIIYKGRRIPLDNRFIFSTSEDLKELVALNKFLPELYLRISVVMIRIPPLRERLEDIPYLARHILHMLNQKYGRVIYDITDDAIDKLKRYDWPGNIRELENVLDRAILNMMPSERILTSNHIPDLIEQQPTESELPQKTLKELLNDYEKEIILKTLKRTHGNKTQAAKLLGLTVRNLYYKLEKYGI